MLNSSATPSWIAVGLPTMLANGLSLGHSDLAHNGSVPAFSSARGRSRCRPRQGVFSWGCPAGRPEPAGALPLSTPGSGHFNVIRPDPAPRPRPGYYKLWQGSGGVFSVLSKNMCTIFDLMRMAGHPAPRMPGPAVKAAVGRDSAAPRRKVGGAGGELCNASGVLMARPSLNTLSSPSYCWNGQSFPCHFLSAHQAVRQASWFNWCGAEAAWHSGCACHGVIAKVTAAPLEVMAYRMPGSFATTGGRLAHGRPVAGTTTTPCSTARAAAAGTGCDLVVPVRQSAVQIQRGFQGRQKLCNSGSFYLRYTPKTERKFTYLFYFIAPERFAQDGVMCGTNISYH